VTELIIIFTVAWVVTTGTATLLWDIAARDRADR